MKNWRGPVKHSEKISLPDTVTAYILDSDILNYLDNNDSPFHENCLQRLSEKIEERLCISILTVFELDYRIEGANNNLRTRLIQTREDILRAYEILPLTLSISERYGPLKAMYKHATRASPKSMRVHTVDMILAATALETRAILVSNDQIFSRLGSKVSGLIVVNWAEDRD